MSTQNPVKTPYERVRMEDLIHKTGAELSVSGEDRPENVRAEILSYLRKTEILEIDMSSLRNMSPSFAYNAFGMLYDDLGAAALHRLNFVNDLRNLKSRVVSAFERRQKILSAVK